jgi:hypothetical protein
MTPSKRRSYVLDVPGRWITWPPVIALSATAPLIGVSLVWFNDNSTLSNRDWPTGILFWGTFVVFQYFWLRSQRKVIRYIRSDHEHVVTLTPSGLHIRLFYKDEQIPYARIERAFLSRFDGGRLPDSLVIKTSRPVPVHLGWGAIWSPFHPNILTFKTLQARHLLEDIQSHLSGVD